MERKRTSERESARVPDRRKANRFRATYPATLRTLFSQRELCVCRDMSTKGGLFNTASEHKPGDALELQLYINVPEGPAHKAMARVVRVRKRTDEDSRWSYDTAVEFASPTRKITDEASKLSVRQRVRRRMARDNA